MSILGTGSDVGKSVVVAALCRIFNDLGVHVAPFKAQNMSNNSFVTPGGGEMGRAQVVQAEAARIPLHVDMNPVLLKPCTDTGAQVIVQGKALGNRKAADYFADTAYLFDQAQESLRRLRSAFDLIIMEGAGSCAEVNLMPRDFVNFRMACAADAPVILVADIDRGGVFAQIIGTLDVIPQEYKERVKGFIINRFRGDSSLFKEGIEYIQKRTRIPVLGLIPCYCHIEIDAEDGLPLDAVVDPPFEPEQGKINIAVLRFPHISNFTDFAPLRREPGVTLHYLSKPRPLGAYDSVILPGSKNVRFDLSWMRRQGWTDALAAYIRQGGHVCGICGGYQMLGRKISDPHGVEGPPGESGGLGFLDVKTVLSREKTLSLSSGVWEDSGEKVKGYEIHMGVTQHTKNLCHAIHVTERNGSSTDDMDGAVSVDGAIWGTYFHGVFDSPGFRRSFLEGLKPGYCHFLEEKRLESEEVFKNRQYDLLAEHFRRRLDIPKLLEIAGIEVKEEFLL
jgi:adenosylcobyric acid synthase